MFSRFKIDQLLVFFLLAIAFLLISFRSQIFKSQGLVQNGLKKYFDLENVVLIPSQGESNFDHNITLTDPSLEILYSLNGGQDYVRARELPALNHLKNSELTTIPTSYHWKQPIGNFPECKNLVVKLSNKKSGALTEKKVLTFFSDQHSDLPVVSLTIPQNDLISEESGLMVFGKSAYTDKGFYVPWWNRSANFRGRGYGWEREVFFQYFENGDLEFEQFCGLRISGNATRGFPQKSMQILARKTYGNEKLEHRFFSKEGQKKYTSLVIRCSGNDNTKTLFADLLMHRLANNSNVITQKGKPISVFINGNYWGIYNLRERIDEYLISKIEDVREDEITILEGTYGAVKEGSEKEKGRFDEFMIKIENTKNVDSDFYQEISDFMDIMSFTDYLIFETYFGNSDWPDNNSMWYKAGEKKWKWILNDLDYGLTYLGSDNVNTNLFVKLAKSESVVGKLFNKLITNQTFKNSFKERAKTLLKTNLSEQNVRSTFDELISNYQSEIKYQINRWRMIDSIDDWEKNCNANLAFLLTRNEIYLNQILEL